MFGTHQNINNFVSSTRIHIQDMCICYLLYKYDEIAFLSRIPTASFRQTSMYTSNSVLIIIANWNVFQFRKRKGRNYDLCTYLLALLKFLKSIRGVIFIFYLVNCKSNYFLIVLISLYLIILIDYFRKRSVQYIKICIKQNTSNTSDSCRTATI